jgi:hypothetical protein
VNVVLIVFFNSEGAIRAELVPRGNTVNSIPYKRLGSCGRKRGEYARAAEERNIVAE